MFPGAFHRFQVFQRGEPKGFMINAFGPKPDSRLRHPQGILPVPGGVEAETRQALQNLSAILEAAGSSLSRVLKVTVYVKNIEDYGLVNQVYAAFFAEEPPARAIVQGALPAGALVEFDAIAVTKK